MGTHQLASSRGATRRVPRPDSGKGGLRNV